MNPVMEVEGLNKNLGGFELRDVSFSLPEGCITGFIGVNGAGKTTTIKSILGLIPNDSGEVRMFGKTMEKHARELKNRIGIVFDEGYFYEDLTMAEMKSVLAPAYSTWDNAAFSRHMERFGLHPAHKISTLSKGNRMKFAIALALSHHADLLIMDEPTSGLDPLVRSEIMEIMLEYMKEDGKSVFFSTHITSDLDKIADMLILIDKGRLIFNEDKDLLLDTHGFVKGDRADLSEHTRKLFLTLRETRYGFEGLTAHKQAVKEQMNKALIEKPTIEDIMLGYVRR
ncbi:ABC transporter ATP-binding protein [Paenibacillus oceani]|uniref:ABC transporter ATP-binding protein n=1 Tax=Paenibacillus oceani TaxID=2772510 RepID=A0A927C6W1_9BACL|nr:ABC transporter ATP-binding protein [Paenibacillus oceani]MBD2860621.1 ABC transporter ATP-binding protein [Paenibacillus oceani]